MAEGHSAHVALKAAQQYPEFRIGISETLGGHAALRAVILDWVNAADR